MHEKYIEIAEERLEAAKYLFEGEFYNAVSRAYYSMFYAEYDIEKRISKEEAESIIDDAERFLDNKKKQ